jgi:hypothetical protein
LCIMYSLASAETGHFNLKNCIMRSNNSYIKKQKADEKAKRRKEKFNNMLEKKNNPKKDFESMIAYVDKFGQITSEPPIETNADPETIK